MKLGLNRTVSNFKKALKKASSFLNTYSLDFDGVDDRLSLPEVVYSGAFTFSFWAKPNSLSLAFVCGDYNSNGYFVWLFSTTRIILKTSGGSYNFQESGGNNIIIGDWQNIVITRDSSNNINCYVNGVSFGTTGNLGGNFEFNSIGKVYSASSSWYFNGGIDEFAVWDNDQSLNIATISTAPTVDLSSLNPTQWYRMGDNGAYKSPQFLLPNNENKDKISNYSFEFDGVDDYVNCGVNLAFATVPNLSISYWIKTDATLTNFASYFSIGVNVSYVGGAYNYSAGRLYKTGTGLVVYIQGAGSSSGSTLLDDGNWHHIIQTYSDNGNNTSRVRIYVDGNTTPEVDLASTLSYAPLTSNLFIGARNASADRGFPGSVDEVSVWDSVLSTSDITAIWNSGTPTTISGAIAHYKMGEEATFSTNWTVPDAAGSNDGTSANMTIEDRVGEAPNSENNALSFNMDEVDRVEDTP